MSTGPIAMDVVGLRTCIGSTVDPHADTRRQAELNLKNVGFDIYRVERIAL